MIPKILSKSEADEISSCIDEAKHVVIVCHVAPDGIRWPIWVRTFM